MEPRFHRVRSHRWKQVTAAAAAGALAVGLASCASDDTVVVNVYGGTAAVGFDRIIAACNEAAEGRYRIQGNLLPADADSQREQFVRRLASRDSGMDLLGMDVTWTAEFAEAGWIRELTPEQAELATADILQPPIDTATWQDVLYGIPKHTNVQLLWYRPSLTPEPPQTWDEMLEMASDLRDRGEIYEIGFTGARYEGLVVGFNTLLNSFGGDLVNEDSTEATIDENTVQALELLQRYARSGLASASLSNAQEPEVFAEFQQGRSAFSLNWPYVLSAMRSAAETDAQSRAVYEDMAFATYPEVVPGETPSVTLGGMNYAISTYSEHPDEAFDAAMCLRNPEHQLWAALDAGDVPSNITVYDDPEFQEAYPMYEILLEQLEVAVPRPKTPFYQNISTIVSSALSPPAAIDPEATADELRDRIQDTLEGRGILP
ncbi:ABC transporter substrate-binding protein [Hoyosella altamirensis]|uniref:Multiple sugar transport system substrate-binding protein n=2 Tax=Hoyosella altamirensis TaxID=616997 RepID=A0A839RR12_9ACTN|nr:ABC transporter substrate-binding protein [Hoyosella altamirensis]MBB3039255.1 multiple sugar transport system substrate-binding protein [Hoyosella altamirensis]